MKGISAPTDISYPDLLPGYVGQNVYLVFADPLGRKPLFGRLAERRGKYFVGNYAVSAGDSLHSEDMQQFIGWIQRRAA